jgi:hypothetical protein
MISPIYNYYITKPDSSVEHIWPSKNYLNQSKINWHLVEKPLQKRGVYLPLDFNKVKEKSKFNTFHDEHLVIDFYIKNLENNVKLNKNLIDIGAGDGVDMSNTFNLIMEGFSGHLIEMNSSKFAKLSTIYRKFSNVTLHRAKVTPHNIINLINFCEIDQEVDVLNLDIDSYDFFVLVELLKHRNFKFLILEINPYFPINIDFSVTYDKEFTPQAGLFQGASVSKFYKILQSNNYCIVHVDRSFVLGMHKSLLNNKLIELSPQEINTNLTNSLRKKESQKFEKYYKKIRSQGTQEALEHIKKEFSKYSNFEVSDSGL